jgi:hypothetical protein
MDTDEVFDVQFDYSEMMTQDSDTLVASAWSVPSGLALGDGATPVTRDTHTVIPAAPSYTTTTATAWLYATSAGTYTVENTVETAGGRIHSRSFTVVVTDR